VVLLTAASAGFLFAPAAWHRVLFRRGEREAIVRHATTFVVIGLVLLASAMTGTVLLIGYVVFGGVIGGVLGAVIGFLFALLWFVWPKTFAREHKDSSHTGASTVS